VQQLSDRKRLRQMRATDAPGPQQRRTAPQAQDQ
jgi:hypothetical protein